MADLASQPTDLADEVTDASVSAEPPASVAADAASEPIVASLDATEPVNEDLLGELARAMHVAATSQYERMNAELERRRTEQVEAITARATSDAESVKASLEADIAQIDAWAKTETEKIKQERLRRIDGRRGQLAAQLEREDTIRQREVFAIEVAIDAHRGEIDTFFGRMERESDPTAIARVASSLPPFPALDEIAGEARRSASAEFASLDAQSATAAVQDARTQEDATSEDAAPAPAATQVAEAVAPEGTESSALDETASDAVVSETRLMAVMDPDASRDGGHEATPPWEAPYAVSVAAGSGPTKTAPEPEPHGRVGSTLLRTVRAIRPMAGSDKDANR